MMYKWIIHFHTHYDFFSMSNKRLRLHNAGFIKFQTDGVPTYCESSGDYYYRYEVTHKSRSAMMMYMLKHPEDNITVIEEYSDA
jgi:hypothetical protein